MGDIQRDIASRRQEYFSALKTVKDKSILTYSWSDPGDLFPRNLENR